MESVSTEINENLVPIPAITEDLVIDANEIKQIEIMQGELETLIQKIEVLAQKDAKNTHLMKDLKHENEALKEENQKLRSIINDQMQNFECFCTKLKDSLNLDHLEDYVKMEQRMNELNDKITHLEEEKADLIAKNVSLLKENEQITKKTETILKNFDEVNEIIVKSMGSSLIKSQVQRIKKLENRDIDANKKTSKAKKVNGNSLHSSQKKVIEDQPKRSPLKTRKRAAAAAATKQLNIEEKSEKDSDNIEEDEDEEFEVAVSDDNQEVEEEGEEDDEEFYTPKKGKRKANATKKVQQVKKVKKNENKELLAQKRNTIQYQLFG